MNEHNSELKDLFVEVASRFSEAVYAAAQPTSESTNIFGRKTAIHSRVGMSRLLGVASTGLRTAAHIPAEDLIKNLPVLKSFARMHIPFTLVVEGEALGYLPELARSGVMIFQACNHQELLDWILMAQVISEKSLIPVVILAEFSRTSKDLNIPADEELRRWFGDNDGRVEDPTPAQSMVFGRMRRRMPGWLHTDNPVMLGAKKQHRDKLSEQTARTSYDWSHACEIIDQSLEQFFVRFGRRYTPCRAINVERARKIVLTTASWDPHIIEGILSGNPFKRERIGLVSMFQLWPIALPGDLINQKIERFLVLEPASYHGDQGWLYKEIVSQMSLSPNQVQNAWFVHPPDLEGLRLALQNMVTPKDALMKYWLDLSLHGFTSVFPKYQLLLETLNRMYPDNKKYSASESSGIMQVKGSRTSMAARQFSGKGAPYTRLSEFHDHTACLYDTPEAQVVHPFDAIPALPAATAIYHQPNKREEVPVFHPQNVEEIERYPGACPHGALLTSVFTLQELIKSGISEARKRGEAIALIVPLSKVWAKNAAGIAKDKKNKIILARDLLAPAFEKTLPKAKKDPEKVKEEYLQIMKAIGEVPVALTKAHYYLRETEKPDTGELFTLAIDPDTCTGCGSCALATNEAALEMKPVREVPESELTSCFRRYEALPETSAAITKRLIEDENFDPFAALLLNKGLYRSFSRGGIRWQKAAETSTIGMISAVTEDLITTRFDAIVKQISVQTAGINNAIKKLLSDALPVTRLESLMEVITRHSEEKLNMDRIFDEWGQEQQFKTINKVDLERKLEVVEGLKQLKWAIQEGLNGQGRAPYSVVLDQSVDYLAEHPWNAFRVPVILAGDNETGELALGVFEGELRNVLDNLRLLRRAQLEAANKYKPEQHNHEIAALSWPDLTEDEKALVTPLLVIGTEEILTHGSSNSLLKLLDQEPGYPIKVIILESGSLNPGEAAVQINGRSNALWSLMAQNRAFVGRGSLADARYLFNLLKEGIDFRGPAVLSVLTPDAFAYDSISALWPRLTALAESCRLFLPMYCHPGADHMAERVELNISDLHEDWNKTKLSYDGPGEEKTLEYALTFADYAYLLKEWKPEFTLLEHDANTVAVSEYLDLNEDSTTDKIPVIKRVDTRNHLVLYSVSDEVIKATRVVRSNFRLMREWAGLYTAFPDKLRQEVDADLRKEYELEKNKLKAELAAEKKNWEAEHLQQVKQQMKDRLIQMTGQK